MGQLSIAVIGGTGLMGPYLLDILCGIGYTTTCLNRRGQAHVGGAIACDRRNPEQLKRLLGELKPDVVVDMIPFIQSDAQNIVEALDNREDVRVIAVSSIDVYQAYGRLHRTEPGPYQQCPIEETGALRELPSIRHEFYDKIAVERTYLKNFENVSILRLPAIYGWPDISRVKDYLDVLETPEKALRIHPDFAKWSYSRASAKDCARAILLTVPSNGQNIYNVAEETLLTEEAWCQAIWSSAGQSAEIIYDESVPIPFNIDTQQTWHVSSQKIRKELGYRESQSMNAVLQETIERILASRG